MPRAHVREIVMTPFTDPTTAACHAGQAARAEQDRYDADQAALLARGRGVLLTKSAADLADMLDDVRAAVEAARAATEKPADVWSLFLAEQDDNWADLTRIDTAAIEDAAAILRNAGRG